MPQKIIIDTDPGIDDTIAILVALRSPELEVVGFTTVFGNSNGETTAQNALRLAELEGNNNIPVSRGNDIPLLIPLKPEDIASEVHGIDGMGNTNPPLPKGHLTNQSAAEFIVETVHACPGEITLVAIGPLTNIALALKIDPNIEKLIKQIVLMGGTVSTPGNISPVSEANIFHDPHAASIVMSSKIHRVMVGLDVTQQTIMTPDFFQSIFSIENPATNLIRRILPVYQKYHDQQNSMNGSTFTHDPSAIAYLLKPELFITKSVPIIVELDGNCRGQTIADWHHQMHACPETNVCMEVNSAGVLELIKERLTKI
jgi:purine nucleosidase